jgi:DNA-binding PadR family transcriptional regulator
MEEHPTVRALSEKLHFDDLREIAACTERDPSPGALYTTLDRLEDRGLVSSKFGDPSPQRGGRAKRFFKVTRSGIQAVARVQRGYQRLLKGVSLPGVSHA